MALGNVSVRIVTKLLHLILSLKPKIKNKRCNKFSSLNQQSAIFLVVACSIDMSHNSSFEHSPVTSSPTVCSISIVPTSMFMNKNRTTISSSYSKTWDIISILSIQNSPQISSWPEMALKSHVTQLFRTNCVSNGKTRSFSASSWSIKMVDSGLTTNHSLIRPTSQRCLTRLALV